MDMGMIKILQLSSRASVLRAKNKNLTPNEILSSEIQALIQEMKMIMRKAPGVGLAAPQIGVNLNLAVIEDEASRLKDVPEAVLEDRGRRPVAFHVIINPVITKFHGKTKLFFEGCLSVKGKVRITPRYESVTVECLDEHGEQKIIEASGWYARILQHEIDHLNGRLYVDIAGENTEMRVDEHFKNEWMNAGSDKLEKFYYEAKMLEALPLASIENIKIQASRVGGDVNAIVYRGNNLYEIAFFDKLESGQFIFNHKFDLAELYNRFCANNHFDYNIRQIGDVVLHRPARDVKEFSENRELKNQLEIMKRNLYITGGVGIAANQYAEIENPSKIILSGVNYDNSEHVIKAITRYQTALFPCMKVLINPVIIKLDKSLSEFTEGCLSVRGAIRGIVKRPKTVTVRYQDLNGEFHEETFSGTDARVMLHELDHILNGFVYLQRLLNELSSEQKSSLKKTLQAILKGNKQQENKVLFSKPVTLFERDVSGCMIFDNQTANEVFTTMSEETLTGILSQL